ncbi:MAG: hypothetical protein NTZ69_16090 [Bacteroidia bacterium]|nr:hypothetical protein [Bacteroidia bacterium]
MKKFSELGIKGTDARKMFNCNQVSISDVINCEIEVIDFIPAVKTKHGDGRSLVHFKLNGQEGKFFSNAESIKSVLDEVPKEEFPFLTTIKCTKCGNGRFYQFT